MGDEVAAVHVEETGGIEIVQVLELDTVLIDRFLQRDVALVKLFQRQTESVAGTLVHFSNHTVGIVIDHIDHRSLKYRLVAHHLLLYLVLPVTLFGHVNLCADDHKWLTVLIFQHGEHILETPYHRRLCLYKSYHQTDDDGNHHHHIKYATRP